MKASLAEKYERLQERLRELGSVVVALSGGLDSTLLLRVAVSTLGPDRVLAVTGRSPSLPQSERDSAEALAAECGAAHLFIDTSEFDDPNYRANPVTRCYFCKTALYSQLWELAAERGFNAVVCGTNADDLHDFRPGQQAADEFGVRAPLAEAGLTKAEIRELARDLGLSVHDKPASPCLSSRVQYGEAIDPQKLRRIDQAETFLRELGFRDCRVRHHGGLARIEVPADQIARFADPQLRQRVDQKLRELGYCYVTLDLRGFRSGSMNEAVADRGPGRLRCSF